MRITPGVVTLVTLTSTVWLAGISTDAPAKETPFTVAVNKRNIVLRDRPTDAFVWVSDAAWNLVQELSREQINEYLDIRAAVSFDPPGDPGANYADRDWVLVLDDLACSYPPPGGDKGRAVGPE